MTREEAIESLSFHSGGNPDVDNPRWSNGFLAKVHSFQYPDRHDFDEVMECIFVLSNEFGKESLDNELILDVLSIINLTRQWSSPDMRPQDKYATLIEWVDTMEHCLWWLLQDDRGEALNWYENCLAE